MEKAIELLSKFKDGLEGMTPEGYEDGIFIEGKISGIESAITILEEAIKIEVKHEHKAD